MKLVCFILLLFVAIVLADPVAITVAVNPVRVIPENRISKKETFIPNFLYSQGSYIVNSASTEYMVISSGTTASQEPTNKVGVVTNGTAVLYCVYPDNRHGWTIWNTGTNAAYCTYGNQQGTIPAMSSINSSNIPSGQMKKDVFASGLAGNINVLLIEEW